MRKIGFLSLVITSLVLASVVMAFTEASPVETTGGAAVGVNEYISITVTIDPTTPGIDFGDVDPGTTRNKDTDQVDGATSTTPAGSITNDAVSNIDAYIRLKGDGFSDGTNTIAVLNVVYDDDGEVDGGTEPGGGPLSQQTMSTSYPGTAYTSLTPGSSVDLWFWMDIPSTQAAGDYSTTFYFQGARS